MGQGLLKNGEKKIENFDILIENLRKNAKNSRKITRLLRPQN